LGHEYVLPEASAGMPGLASSQSNPSRPPEPEQWLPHETSFSPVTLTHLPLRHWVSLEQKQPPGPVHSLELPLQLPNEGQEYPDPVEIGQPLAGQGTETSAPESGPPSAPPSGLAGATHMLFTHVAPPMQGAPQPPQLASSLLVLTQLPLQIVDMEAGQVPAQANVPPGPSAHTDASPSQVTSQPPQLDTEEGLTQPASHAMRPPPQPPSDPASAPGPPSPSGASVPGPVGPPSSPGCTLASQSSVQAEYALSPDIAAQEPSTVARATALTAPNKNRIILRFF
jgi:hypothetical protein